PRARRPKGSPAPDRRPRDGPAPDAAGASCGAAAGVAPAGRRGAAGPGGPARACASCRARLGLVGADGGEPVADAPDVLDPVRVGVDLELVAQAHGVRVE